MSSEIKIREYLERSGWRREIAGAADFSAAVQAIKAADEGRLKDLCVPLKLVGKDKREWKKPGAVQG